MTPVNVVTRAPHDQVLDRVRAAHLALAARRRFLADA
ncbi:hypothetical protein L603_001600000480 [Cellulosimicrobium cellulans J34]|nr:hypothetical protein L603_001600000480 [Cellulosimicrobium cellulans J34]SMF04789.1 hypothetical protein SAMN02744115_01092 [Cellulosimicrobium cellulans J1]